MYFKSIYIKFCIYCVCALLINEYIMLSNVKMKEENNILILTLFRIFILKYTIKILSLLMINHLISLVFSSKSPPDISTLVNNSLRNN